MHRRWSNDPLQATRIRSLPWSVASWLVVVLCDGQYMFFSATVQNHQPHGEVWIDQINPMPPYQHHHWIVFHNLQIICNNVIQSVLITHYFIISKSVACCSLIRHEKPKKPTRRITQHNFEKPARAPRPSRSRVKLYPVRCWTLTTTEERGHRLERPWTVAAWTRSPRQLRNAASPPPTTLLVTPSASTPFTHPIQPREE